jgi:hypothetical protein
MENSVRGCVRQHAYLGDQQDLRIDIAGGLQVRALASSQENYAAGDEVVVQVPTNGCQIVTA